MSANPKLSSRPRLACEVSSDAVVAGRAAPGGQRIEAFCARELPPGSVAPDLTEPNVRRPDELRRALSDSLGALGARSRDVIAVLPDASVRVVLLDFESLPDKPREAEAVVRFRLKKSLPFDVEQAQVSYHAQASADGPKVVAVVALCSVLEEYEAAFRDAGYSPGVVVPSMLAALGAVDALQPTLVVKVDPGTTSIAILDQGKLLLFRTLENARGSSITGEQLAEDVYPSLVFFQDTYKLDIARIYIAGLPESSSAAPALAAQTGAEVQELVSSRRLGASPRNGLPRWKMSGVVGALVS